MKSDTDILLERAKNHARRIDDSRTKNADIISVIEFNLFSAKYAFEESYVSEVLFLRDLTPIPGTPSFVMGVINFRSKILSVINLQSLFNLREKGLFEMDKVIVLDNGKNYFGVIANSISGRREIGLSTISQPAINFDSLEAEFISGILPDGLIILNAQKMLASSTLIINQ